jgi:hypothetical protein
MKRSRDFKFSSIFQKIILIGYSESAWADSLLLLAYNGLVHTPVPDLLSNTQFTVFRAIQQKELSFRFQAFY